jgi:D-amino-acid dehydrogenase
MRILILGGGVVGTTTAYYLAKAGHEVELVDRQEATGMETSFANAGQVSPGYSSPWAGPGVPLKAIKWLMMRNRPFVIRSVLGGGLPWWLGQMLANCNEDAYHRNKSRMVRLAEYSRDALRDLRAEIGISYDHGERGTLQLFRSQREFDHVGDDTDVLDAFNVGYEVLDANGCIQAEPALALVQGKFVGALRLVSDETGDAHMFTQRLAAIAEGIGVRFRFGINVHKIEATAMTVTGVITDRGMFSADRYIIALGSYSAALLKPLGIYLPVYPVKGYSLTMPIKEVAAAPISTVMDERYKVAITRLGDRIRVGGTAELAGFSQSLRHPRRATLEHSAGDLFPRGGDSTRATFWTGLRPMTPDGTPVVGATPYSNLLTNTGHGTLGWTMACGSARVLTDLIGGRSTEIDSDDLGLRRYAR